MTEHNMPKLEWLRRIAAAEEEHRHIGVGGLAADAGFLGSSLPLQNHGQREQAIASERPAARIVFARFLDLARRSRTLSLEALADQADVDLGELVEIIEDYARPSPRTVYQLSRVLEVPNEKLLELAGLIEPREEVTEAAVRFAARSEPVALSKDERAAFEEFVKVLVEKSDAG